MTHAYAEMEVSAGAFKEIEGKLREAGYQDQIHEGPTLDMHGIGLVIRETTERDRLIDDLLLAKENLQRAGMIGLVSKKHAIRTIEQAIQEVSS